MPPLRPQKVWKCSCGRCLLGTNPAPLLCALQFHVACLSGGAPSSRAGKHAWTCHVPCQGGPHVPSPGPAPVRIQCTTSRPLRCWQHQPPRSPGIHSGTIHHDILYISQRGHLCGCSPPHCKHLHGRNVPVTERTRHKREKLHFRSWKRTFRHLQRGGKEELPTWAR